MEVIKVRTGERILYIEKEKTETLYLNPKIWKVPGAGDEILGVSVYKGRLAVYYRLGSERDAKCGILMKTQGDMTVGVAAEEVAGEEEDTDRMPYVQRTGKAGSRLLWQVYGAFKKGQIRDDCRQYGEPADHQLYIFYEGAGTFRYPA